MISQPDRRRAPSRAGQSRTLLALLGAVLSLSLVTGWSSASASTTSASATSSAVPYGYFDGRGMTEDQAVQKVRAILAGSSEHKAAMRPMDSIAGNDLPSAPNCDKDQNSVIEGYIYAFRGYNQQWTSNGHTPYEINWYAVKVEMYPYGLVNVGPSTHTPCYNTW